MKRILCPVVGRCDCTVYGTGHRPYSPREALCIVIGRNTVRKTSLRSQHTDHSPHLFWNTSSQSRCPCRVDKNDFNVLIKGKDFVIKSKTYLNKRIYKLQRRFCVLMDTLSKNSLSKMGYWVLKGDGISLLVREYLSHLGPTYQRYTLSTRCRNSLGSLSKGLITTLLVILS